MSAIATVYAVFADAGEAERVTRMVVEEELAACANILAPCRSIYRWEGKIESADEVPAILKTTAAQADSLIARIAGLHSYDLPCVAVWPVDKLLGSYAEWVESEVR